MSSSGKESNIGAKAILLPSFICLVTIFLMNGALGTVAAQSEERVLVNAVPKQLPIKVEIKKGKEKAFKDLKNEKWVRELELEVTNTGDKPIYYLDLELIPEGVKSDSGYPIGFPLRYGRPELLDFSLPILRDDVPIQPGQTYTFNVPDQDAGGWEIYTSEINLPKDEPKKVRLEFYWLNFGDGTGFGTSAGEPYPWPKNNSSNGPCKEPKKQNTDLQQTLY
jgi:hypothetical protein